jgi:hypothetical protein
MNILLKEPFPRFGLIFPMDFDRAKKEGLDFKIAPDHLVKEALESPSDSYEKAVWLPMVKEATYRMIIHSLMFQMNEMKTPWYKKVLKKFKRIT